MDVDSRSPSPGDTDQEPHSVAPRPGTVTAALRILQEEGPRNRSPTPPRALFRSTTGKGVAFTDEDVAFLVKFLAYRKSAFFPTYILLPFSFFNTLLIVAVSHSQNSVFPITAPFPL